MEQTELPSSVSPDTFPAKLWWLVNNPQILSITWDDRGQGLLIDEHLFISEVLETDLSFAPGLEVSWAAGSSELFKTRSFPSFIRQLNLYGFHKLSKGLMPGRRPGPCHGAGDSNGVKHGCFLHHFHSPYFLRDRPELLVHLKRLTKANKAKLLGTKDLPSQKPNQPKKLPSRVLQRGLLLPSSMSGKANSPVTAGPLAEGQSSQPHCQDNIVAPSYTLTPTLAHSTSVTKTSNTAPFSSTLSKNFFTTVTYTVQPVSSVLPLQECPTAVDTSLTQDSSSAPSEQCSQASCPTDTVQSDSTPAHTDPLPDLADLDALADSAFDFFQDATDAELESIASLLDEAPFIADDDLLNQIIEDLTSSFQPTSKKRKLEDDFSDLLEETPCKQSCLLQEETRE